MNNGVSGAYGVSGCYGASDGSGIVYYDSRGYDNGYIPDEKLEKVGLKLKNIFSQKDQYGYSVIIEYNVCDKNGNSMILTQQQYNNIYKNYIRKQKLLKINE